MQLRRWDGLLQTPEDLNRKFGGTFVFGVCPDVDETPRVYQITEIQEASVFGRYVSLPGARSHTFSGEWRTFDVQRPYPPQMGAIPFHNKVLFIQRNPARQWHVGLLPANTTLLDHNLRPSRIGFGEAEALFSPQYAKQSVEEAVKSFDNAATQAVALSPQYWLARRDDKICLFQGRLSLGSFVFGGFFLHNACRDLRQELWDDLKLKVM